MQYTLNILYVLISQIPKAWVWSSCQMEIRSPDKRLSHFVYVKNGNKSVCISVYAPNFQKLLIMMKQ